MSFPISWFATFFLIVTYANGCARSTTQNPRTPLEAVTSDLCDKEVALIGESSHGDGKTFEFKVEVVRKLIDQCGYTAVFWESGMYDFWHFKKELETGKKTNFQMIESAVGRLWSGTKELKGLFPYLYQKAKMGQLEVAGLDDQLTGPYAQNKMAGELSEYLPDAEMAHCQSALERYTHYRYDETSPYDTAEKEKILSCLKKIEGKASEGEREMTKNLQRLVGRDFRIRSESELFNQRDRSMYLNFVWRKSKLPAGSKVIVWAATVHVAKSLKGLSREAKNSLGYYISKDYGPRAAAIGFSAFSGRYGMVNFPIRTIDSAPWDSLEGQAFEKNRKQTRYFDSGNLRQFEMIKARPIAYAFREAKWDAILDGIVIFKTEHPPQFE